MKILIVQHSPHVHLAATSNTPINKRYESILDQDLRPMVLL